MSSTIYGFIACRTKEGCFEEAQMKIESLPVEGQMMVKHLFHLIPRSRSFSYYMNMITFGMDQKDNWCVDNEFISQFETFLTSLDWSHAQLVHSWTGTVISWDRKLYSVGDMRYKNRDQFDRTFTGSIHDLPKVDI